jgi:hypothetical protein
MLISVLATNTSVFRTVLCPSSGNPPLAETLVTMSVASGDQPGTAEPCHTAPTVCQFRCILCRQRFWKKNVIIRRSAKCRGTRYNPDGSRWKCRAWRCRFNDQCPNANSACPICGAYKPPEFRPTLPAPEVIPAVVTGSASSADPNPASTIREVPAGHVDHLSRPMQGLPEGSDLWRRYFESRPRSSSSADNMIRAGTETQLPLYGDVVARFLTEV